MSSCPEFAPDGILLIARGAPDLGSTDDARCLVLGLDSLYVFNFRTFLYPFRMPFHSISLNTLLLDFILGYSSFVYV